MPGSQTTVTQDIITGTTAGAAGLVPDHYLWSVQIRLQNGSSFTLNPSILSRGFCTNVASVLPITALQVGLNKGIQKGIFKKNTEELSNSQKILSAFFSGAGSAFLVGPTEYVMNQQAITGKTFKITTQHLIREGGLRCLSTGMDLTAKREGLYTASFLGFFPIFKEKAKSLCSNDYTSSMAASSIAGFIACTLSHKIDTAKTIQQSALLSKPLTFSEASKKINNKQLIKSFAPRLARTIATIGIMGHVAEKMDARFSKKGL
jgi:hypothetical protein